MATVSVDSPVQGRRQKASFYAIGGLLVLAALSQAKLQTVERGHTIALANKTKRYVLSEPVPAKRGTIYSADGQPLAKDENVFDLNVDFRKCPNNEAFWMELAEATGIAATDFSQLADLGVKSRTWPGAIGDSQHTGVNAVRARWRADGVSAVPTGFRDYALGETAACLVGVIRRRAVEVGPNDPRWKLAVEEYGEPRPGSPASADVMTGLESSQDDALRGKNGLYTGVTDRSGQFLPMRVESTTPKVDGKDLTLTIDSGLQSFATMAIKQAVAANHAESGVAIVEDPATGNILAMANWPGFSPYGPDGDYGSMGPHGGLNQAYMSCLEPGSMFKILTLAKALDAGVVHMTDHFYCPGEKVVVPGAKPIKCDLHHGTRAMGDLTPITAIARSCNIWAATWARDVGYANFVSYLESLDLLKRPDIGLNGAVPALFNRNDPAKVLQIANVGFGQSINCTPVSLIGAFSALANKGVRMQPRLIAKVGKDAVPLKPGKKVLSPEAAADVVTGMEAVFENPRGTGHALKIPGYLLAGKTGTAQKMARNDHGYVSNFVGFVPAEQPKAVVLVMINKPVGQYYGASVAGPVFRQIAKEVLSKYHVPTGTYKVLPPEVTEDNDVASAPKRTRHSRSRKLASGHGVAETPNQTPRARLRRSKPMSNDA